MMSAIDASPAEHVSDELHHLWCEERRLDLSKGAALHGVSRSKVRELVRTTTPSASNSDSSPKQPSHGETEPPPDIGSAGSGLCIVVGLAFMAIGGYLLVVAPGVSPSGFR